MLATLVALLLQPLHAATVFWSGTAGDTSWSTPANWTNGIPPADPSDQVMFLGDGASSQGVVNNALFASLTVGALNYRALMPASHTTLIPAGVTLTLVGSRTTTIGNYNSPDALFAGTGADNGATAQAYAAITGEGTLVISNTTANVDVTQTSNLSGNKMSTLDLSGLNLFVANLNQIRVGHGNSGTGFPAGNRCGGTLLLAKTNLIVCNASSATGYGVSVGDSPQNNGPASFLRLGQSNAIFSDVGVGVGRRKAATLPATCVLGFAPGLVNPSALFRNKAGIGPMATWVIGDNGESGAIGSHTSGTMDFSGGILDAWVNTIYLGRTYNSGTTNNTQNAQSHGTLTFTAGSLAANNIEVGYQNVASPAVAYGTLNVLEQAALYVTNDIRLGRWQSVTNNSPATNGAATGVMTLSGRAAVGGRIYDGGGSSTLNIIAGDAANSLLDMQPPGDPVPGTIVVDTLNLTGGVITNAARVSALNFTIGGGAAIVGSTVIELQAGGAMNVQALNSGQGLELGPTQTLQGSGTITGDIHQSPGALISPGGSNAPGTLILSSTDPFLYKNLFLNEGGRLHFDLSADPAQVGGSNDYMRVEGDISIMGVNQITLNPTAGDLGTGSYRLFNYIGLFDGSPANFEIVGPIAQSRRTLALDTTTLGEINLAVGGTAPAAIVWAGDGVNNLWDLRASPNWKLNEASDLFYNLDHVLLDDSGSDSPALSLVGHLIPGSITVSNETRHFTWAGPGSLGGASGLAKWGAGSLTLANSGTNDFTGPVILAGGALRLAAANRLPTNATVVLSNSPGVVFDLNGFDQALGSISGGGSAGGDISLGAGTLDITGAGAFGGIIRGSGRILKSGPGTLQLAGASTYSGGTLIHTGAVVLVNESGSGTGSGPLAILGGTLQIGTNSPAGAIADPPGGTLTNHGALVFNRSDTLNPGYVITGQGSVRVAGSGRVLFDRDHTYTNVTTVDRNNGALRISSPLALGSLEGGTTVAGGNTPGVYPGGQLEMAGGVVFAPERLTLGCRGNATFGEGPSQFVNADGSNTWTGPIDITQGGSWIALQSDAGFMHIAGSIFGGPIATGTRTLILRGTADGEISGVISNGPVTATKNLGKKDTGAWTLSGQNTYNGMTIISNGILRINGAIRGSGVTNYGGVLEGSGVITAPVHITAAATLAPGAPVGTLTIRSNLVLAGATTMELVKSGTSWTFDSVRGLSRVTFGGALNIILTGQPVGGETFQLFEAAAYDGGFDSINLPGLPGSLTWNTTTLATDGTLRIDGSAPAQPVIGNMSLTGADLIITGSGGTAGGAYYVLSSTNAAAPLAAWMPIITNVFGTDGLFIFSVAADTNTPQRFFMLQVP